MRGRTGGGGDAGRTVPACHSCNSWLGNRLLVKVEDRRAYIAGVLRRKVNESAPGWTEEELEDLGPSLRQAVESGLREHSRLLGRLGYAESGSC